MIEWDDLDELSETERLEEQAKAIRRFFKINRLKGYRVQIPRDLAKYMDLPCEEEFFIYEEHIKNGYRLFENKHGDLYKPNLKSYARFELQELRDEYKENQESLIDVEYVFLILEGIEEEKRYPRSDIQYNQTVEDSYR